MTHKKIYTLAFCIGISPYFVNGYVNSIIYGYPLLYWIFELATWIVLPLCVVLFLRRSGALVLEEIGFRSNIFKEGKFDIVIFVGLLYALIGLILYFIFLSAGEALFPGNSLFHYQQVVPESGLARLLIAIYLATSAAFVEEFYFRGLFYKITSYYNRPLFLYMFWSPLLFSLIHWENGIANVFATYFLGLVSALLFVWTRNLWPLIIAHLFTDYYYFG